MPFGTITSTFNTFGSISGGVGANVPGTLSGSVGVPGPAGAPGVGVPAGGLTGQILLKASDLSYDTVWSDNSAETLTATVRNETGATLSKGTVVYISGAAGNKALVSKASAASESSSSKTFAILAQDIPNNQNGTAVTVGLLRGINTLAFTPGANLWLSTTAGEITQTVPVSPNHAVFLGNAVRIHATQGEIEVRIQNGLELGELHDVLITAPTNGQVLKYDAAQSLWVNGTDVGGVAWGGITGVLSSQTDLWNALGSKYDASNPAGYITASALAPYLLSSTAASTYFTIAAAAGKANLASPVFTGDPRAPTPATADNDTSIATTAFVKAQGYLTSAPVTSVAGKTGAVTIAVADVSGLGTMATQTATDYLAKSGNLSGLASTSTARSNLGLGTIATINDAPSDGSTYGRQNGAWVVAGGGGGGTEEDFGFHFADLFSTCFKLDSVYFGSDGGDPALYDLTANLTVYNADMMNAFLAFSSSQAHNPEYSGSYVAVGIYNSSGTLYETLPFPSGITNGSFTITRTEISTGFSGDWFADVRVILWTPSGAGPAVNQRSRFHLLTGTA